MSLPVSRDELLIAALRHANRVGGTLNALAAEISRLLGEAADEPKYGRLYDLLLRRFDSDSGVALFIAARNLRVELPPDLCGELPDCAVGDPHVTEPHDWVIWSEEHGAWWGPGGHGYTFSLRQAGRYSRQQAERIVENANRYLRQGARNEVALPDPWPKEAAS